MRKILLALLLFATSASAQTVGPPPGGSAGSAITSLTGDCTASGPGAAATACPSRNYNVGTAYLADGILPATSAAANPGIGKIFCTIGAIKQKLTISVLSINVTTLGTGNAQVALYANGSTGRPAGLLSSTPSISTGATGVFSGTLAASVQVGPGSTNGRNIWFCANVDNSTAILSAVSITTGNSGGSTIGTTTTANLFSTASLVAGLSCATTNCNGGSSTFGTWPSTLAGTTWTDVITRLVTLIAFTPASIP